MADDSLERAIQSVRKIIPHFPSKNILQTHQFYTTVLHFKSSLSQNTVKDQPDPTFCAVAIGPGAAANIYFFSALETMRLAPSTAMIGMSTEGLETYYQALKQDGKVTFVEDIENKPWGYRQFEIEDLDGNRLQFFRFLDD